MALLLGRSLEREVGDRVDEHVMESGGRGGRNWFMVEVPMNLDPYNPQTQPPPLTINISMRCMVVIIIHFCIYIIRFVSSAVSVLYLCRVLV